jgi:putative transposase
VRFIDEHKNHRVGPAGLRWGVESICRVLSEHGCPIAPSTYYDVRRRTPSRRAVRDEGLKPEISRIYDANHRLFGARKVWLTLRGEGFDVARCTVERLMRELGIEGARRGKQRRTTISNEQHTRPADLVDRNFNPLAPNRLWVADFTYVPTWAGVVYVAFILDAFSRRILGWRAAMNMHTALVLDALEMAIWTRARGGVTDLTGLVHHNDAGSQYTSIAFTTRLIDAGVDPSAASATPTTTPWPRPPSGCTRPSRSTEVGRGATSTTSRSPPWNGSTGTTTADPTRPSTTSHPSPSKACTTLTEPPSPRPESQQPESPDNPG